MNRINPKDTREVAEIDEGFSQIDPATIKQEDINRLVVKMAISMGVINYRTFWKIKDDILISTAEKDSLLTT